MHPIKYAVQNAGTSAEVLKRLSSFVTYLHGCCADTLLPGEFSHLSAGSTEEVSAWSEKLSRADHHAEALTVAGDIWLKDVQDAFSCAAQRLEELARLDEQSMSAAAIAIGGRHRTSHCP
ncbi:MAG: hypothetical protein ABI771_13710 [Betaproteobacteria bacterium]